MTAARAPKRPAGRRKPFTAIRKGLTEHVLSGRLKGTAFGVYVWLHMQADHRTGTVWTNAGRLAGELGLHPVTLRRDLTALRERGYIRYDSEPGRRELYAVTIEKYDRNFDGPDVLDAEPDVEQVPLQAPSLGFGACDGIGACDKVLIRATLVGSALPRPVRRHRATN